MTRAVRRYELSGGETRTFALGSNPLFVTCRRPYIVEFFAIDYDDPEFEELRTFTAVGTSELLPELATTYYGTAIDPTTRLAWHLFEIEPADGLADVIQLLPEATCSPQLGLSA